MRVRRLVRASKTISSDTKWKDGELQARHSGIYPKTMPSRPGWKWRSAIALDGDQEYILLCQINEGKDNWLAWLIRRTADGGSLVSRYEYHGNHPGLHVHADCERGGIELGPTSIKVPLRIPRVKYRSTRTPPARPDLFWKNACAHFRFDYAKGELL